MLAGVLALAGAAGACWAHAGFARCADFAGGRERARLVRSLDGTDLCLFPEAGYTRHLSQADRHTPFQDHPFSLEHFPSGSLASPP